MKKFIIAGLVLISPVYPESIREKWNDTLVNNNWETEQYLIEGACGGKTYDLYYIENRLRMVRYDDYEGCATEFGNAYHAYYSDSGNLEFAYYYIYDVTSCKGVIIAGQKVNEHVCKKNGKSWKEKTTRLGIKQTTSEVMKEILEFPDKAKPGWEYGFKHNINRKTGFKMANTGDETIITGTGVRLRKTPNLKGEILTTLSPFQKVKIVGLDENWTKIKAILFPESAEHDGDVSLTGYVSREFLAAVNPLDKNEDINYWKKNKCSWAAPDSLLRKKKYITLDNEKGIGYENIVLTPEIKLQIVQSSCASYSLTLKFMIKNEKVNHANEYWIKKYADLFPLADTMMNSPVDLEEVSNALKVKTRAKNIIFKTYGGYDENDNNKRIQLAKIKKQGHEIIMQADFEIKN